MAKQMLINHVPGDECRIALLEDGRLEDYHTERSSDDLHINNIYRGRVTNVEPSIQAAFVDFGIGQNGFLHISDLHPRYFPDTPGQITENVGKRTPWRDRPPIQHALKRGQEILVQVLKEGIGTKGPTLTSYLSVPGRYLVMMPHMARQGVSRKVEDPDERKRMRQILSDLDPPSDIGFIVRTAGIGRTKTELKRDLSYLMRVWRSIESKAKRGSGPTELFVESDLVIRTLRDVLSSDMDRIIVDEPTAARRARDFLRIAMPRRSPRLIFYNHALPLFDAFDIERQIQTIHEPRVPLPSGGSLSVDQTEALVAIDVNSGKSKESRDAEQNAFQTNLEAVEEIARQLRLRDLGGLIVLDLIDMAAKRHKQQVERRIRELLKKDRARTKPLRISELGLVEMTRQRMRPSLKTALHETCQACRGTGHVRSAEAVVFSVTRQLAVALQAKRVHRMEVTTSPTVASVLFNRKRRSLLNLEELSEKEIAVKVSDSVNPDEVRIDCFDSKGAWVDIEKLPRPKPPVLTDADAVSDEALPGEEAAGTKPTAPSPGGEGQEQAPTEEPGSGRKKRRRRRGKRRRDGEAPSTAEGEHSEGEAGDGDDSTAPPEAAEEEHEAAETSGEAATSEPSGDRADQEPQTGGKPSRRRKRGGRRRRGRRRDSGQHGAEDGAASPGGEGEAAGGGERETADDASAVEQGGEQTAEVGGEPTEESAATAPPASEDASPPKKRRSGNGRRRKRSKKATGEQTGEGTQDQRSDTPGSAGEETAAEPADESAVARPAAESDNRPSSPASGPDPEAETPEEGTGDAGGKKRGGRRSTRRRSGRRGSTGTSASEGSDE